MTKPVLSYDNSMKGSLRRYGTSSKVSVDYIGKHHVVVRKSGGSYWDNSGHNYVQGCVEVFEVEYYKRDGDTTMAVLLPRMVFSATTGRRWRTAVKEAVAAAEEFDAKWSQTVAEREEMARAEKEAEEAEARVVREIDRLKASLASSPAMKEFADRMVSLVEATSEVALTDDQIDYVIKGALHEALKA